VVGFCTYDNEPSGCVKDKTAVSSDCVMIN
jgi:hypothetical protein